MGNAISGERSWHAMKRLLSVFLVTMLATGAAVLSRPALAAETDADEEGFSAYSVARIKIFQGTAWIRSPDSGEWEETTTNSPITERTRVHVPEGSEAELQFHGGQYVLLTGGTEVDIRKFDESNSAFRVRSGEVRFDLPAEDFSPVGVTMPSGGRADFNTPGKYWLFVQDDGQTRLVVRSGESTVSTGKGVHGVQAGQEAMIGQDVHIAAYSGEAEDQSAPPAPLTEEEQQAGVPPAAAYELRDYGEWVNSSDYGYVWRPRVADDWSPYYYGRWVWISPYGWTWVAYEPWGWYPYHYGWWASDPFFGWVWCPFRSFVSVNFVFGNFRFTHFHRHAFFFPANVRFARDGRNVRFVPLRPGERFVRSGFTRSDTRLSRINRPLERGTVFTRTDRGGKSGWREWTSSQGDRRNVQVRERGVRSGEQGIGRSGPGRGERSTVRQERDRSGPDRQERMTPQRGPERQDRGQQRDFRGRGSSLGDRGGTSSSLRRPGSDSGVRTERVRPPRNEQVERRSPPRRMEAPAERVRERRESQSIRSGRARPAGPPAGNFAPNRGSANPGRGAIGRMPEARGNRTPEVRGNTNSQGFRAPRSDGGMNYNRGGGGGERGSSGGNSLNFRGGGERGSSGGNSFNFRGGGERGFGGGSRGGDSGGGRR
jgi:hypothetical protein